MGMWVAGEPSCQVVRFVGRGRCSLRGMNPRLRQGDASGDRVGASPTVASATPAAAAVAAARSCGGQWGRRPARGRVCPIACLKPIAAFGGCFGMNSLVFEAPWRVYSSPYDHLRPVQDKGEPACMGRAQGAPRA